MKTATCQLALVVGTILIIGACGAGDTSDFTTYRDAEGRTLFELPADWNIYTADQLAQLDSVPFLPNLGAFAPISFVAFDGAAAQNLDNVTIDVTESPYPVGAQIIRSINTFEKNSLSRQVLIESVYELSGVQGTQEFDGEDFSFGDQYDGVRRVIGLTDDDGETSGAIYLIAVTNPEATEMYSMAVGCSLACFNDQTDEILKAVDSWLVNTRR